AATFSPGCTLIETIVASAIDSPSCGMMIGTWGIKFYVIPGESRGISEVTFKVSQRDPSTSLGMTSNILKFIRVTVVALSLRSIYCSVGASTKDLDGREWEYPWRLSARARRRANGTLR